MFKLVWKDYIIQKKTLFKIFLYCFFVFQFMSDMGNVYIIGAVGVTYLLLQNACYQEEKNKSEVVLISLPVSRMELVLAKYLTGISYIAVSLVALGLLGVVYTKFFSSTMQLIQPFDVLLAIAITLLQICIFLPIYFKVGYYKGRMISIFIFMLLSFTPAIIVESTPQNIPLANSIGKIFSQGITAQFMMGWVGFILLVLVASILLSAAFYRRRQF